MFWSSIICSFKKKKISFSRPENSRSLLFYNKQRVPCYGILQILGNFPLSKRR